jgi:DNA polymerase V
VRIAELDEKSYREQLWCHTPITDFWRVGRGTAATLASLGCRTMGDVARLSTKNEAVLYKAMGVNAELLIDHAWGWEPTLISDIKAYKPEETGISSGQVLSEPYDFDQAKLIVREMTELMAMDLVRKGVVTRKITLTVGYDRASLIPAEGGPGGAPRYLVARTGRPYRGEVKPDFYGRPAPKMAHGTGNIDRWTSSARRITAVMMDLYDRIIDPDLSVRRMYVAACNLIPEDQIPEEAPVQLDLFTDYAALEKQKESEDAADRKEKKLQKAALAMQERFGKNAVLKGMNLQKGATTIQRNGQIGGHRAGTLPAEGDDPA